MVTLVGRKWRARQEVRETRPLSSRDRFAALTRDQKIQAKTQAARPRKLNALLPGCHSCSTQSLQTPDLAEKSRPYSKTLLPLSILVAPQSEVHCAAAVRDDQAVASEVFSVVHGRHLGDIRRLIRANCRDAGLLRVVPPEDIEQDVLVQVLALIRRQPLALFCDERLTIRLLACVVRRVVQQHARAHGRAKRDYRRTISRTRLAFVDVICPRHESPADALANRDQVEALLARLPEHHRQVVWLRAEGRSWEEISDTAGGTSDSNRMLYTRAVRQLAQAVAQ